MFTLVVLRESVRIEPRKLHYDFIQTIVIALNKKYCNKVILNLGLCISVFDLLEAEDPYVHPGEAAVIVKVKFRLVMFRPFVGEVLEGKVRSSSEEGIHVSLGFFDDILVPPACMQPNTLFDLTEQVWTWNYQDNKMFLDNGEAIRIRILSEHFTETAPLQKEALMAARAAALSEVPAAPSEVVLPSTAPYKLVASIAEDGLGLSRWWLPSTDIEE